MKIKLVVSDARYPALAAQLTEKGFTLDEDADLVLTEKNLFATHLMLKNSTGGHTRVETGDIVFIESFGHDIMVTVTNTATGTGETQTGGTLQAGERLYQLERLLPPGEFLRISNSVIVALNKIEKITPALSSKFTLTMAGGHKVDVTRSYYNIFREKVGI